MDSGTPYLPYHFRPVALPPEGTYTPTLLKQIIPAHQLPSDMPYGKRFVTEDFYSDSCSTCSSSSFSDTEVDIDPDGLVHDTRSLTSSDATHLEHQSPSKLAQEYSDSQHSNHRYGRVYGPATGRRDQENLVSPSKSTSSSRRVDPATLEAIGFGQLKCNAVYAPDWQARRLGHFSSELDLTPLRNATNRRRVRGSGLSSSNMRLRDVHPSLMPPQQANSWVLTTSQPCSLQPTYKTSTISSPQHTNTCEATDCPTCNYNERLFICRSRAERDCWLSWYSMN